MSSSKPRNRSRSPVKRSNERSHHSLSIDKKDRRNSKDLKPKESNSKPHDEKSPNSDAKTQAKIEKNSTHSNNAASKDSKSVSKENKSISNSNQNSNSTQKHSYVSTSSRTYVNPVTGKTERKFSNRCRLFVGNITDMSEEEFTKMFEKYGEYSEAYVNKDKAFGFIKMDTRMAAEAAKNALDGSMRKGRNLTVRFASLSTAVNVSNLGPMVSNEMLEKAFSSFGDVERAVVVVDDRGRSKGYGRVEFARKGNAQNAIQRTNEGFFMIGRSPRPVFTKQQEQTDDEEGLLEKSIERQPMYYSERDAGARFAPPGTFEFEWCQKWKQLDEMKRTQMESLEKQFQEAEDKLETEMVQAVADYEAEINRRELIAKQAELQRQEEMMRQELMRQQAMEMRRHEEARMQEEMRRQEEMRMQEDLLRRQHDELLRRRQQEEVALLHHGARMPAVPAFGVGPPMGPPGFLSPVHNLHPRMPIIPMQRGVPSPGEHRHGMIPYDIDGDRGRDRRSMDRGDRARAGSRSHSSRDRY